MNFLSKFLAGYFHDLAVFYISWADAAEAANDFKEGTRIYELGMLKKAKPANKLEESYKLYQVINFYFKIFTFLDFHLFFFFYLILNKICIFLFLII